MQDGLHQRIHISSASGKKWSSVSEKCDVGKAMIERNIFLSSKLKRKRRLQQDEQWTCDELFRQVGDLWDLFFYFSKLLG